MHPVLSPFKELLQDYKLILASSSPQRRELLQQIGFNFTVEPSPFNEEFIPKTTLAPSEYIKLVATNKALEVAKKHTEDEEAVVIIAADTVIVYEGEIIGKPHEARIAVKTLQKLSGKEHEVYTGVCLMYTGGSAADGGPARVLIRESYFETITQVKMCELSDEMIDSYVESGEPLNKAGAYGIQGIGAVLIQYIKGDYSNVVGLPLNRLCQELQKFIKKF